MNFGKVLISHRYSYVHNYNHIRSYIAHRLHIIHYNNYATGRGTICSKTRPSVATTLCHCWSGDYLRQQRLPYRWSGRLVVWETIFCMTNHTITRIMSSGTRKILFLFGYKIRILENKHSYLGTK